MHISRVRQELQRFHDGGTPQQPPDVTQPPRILLERLTEDGAETFRMGRRIGYTDRELGEILVPGDSAFRTDLTSVPWLFTWLVPKTGAHLPAALIHDGLVGGAHDDPASYVSTEGHVIARDAADRVFRDAMADTGTGVVRRWLVWTAVATATIYLGSEAWSRARLWGYRLAASVTIAMILLLGTLATIDLVDGPIGVPWMGDRPWWSELVGGLAGAIAIPVVLGLLWGRFRMAGAILGVLLAVLIHVSSALLLLTLIYQGVEALARASPWVAATLAGLVVAGSVLLVGGYA